MNNKEQIDLINTEIDEYKRLHKYSEVISLYKKLIKLNPLNKKIYKESIIDCMHLSNE